VGCVITRFASFGIRVKLVIIEGMTPLEDSDGDELALSFEESLVIRRTLLPYAFSYHPCQ
jgi:hypothetical protein